MKCLMTSGSWPKHLCFLYHHRSQLISKDLLAQAKGSFHPASYFPQWSTSYLWEAILYFSPLQLVFRGKLLLDQRVPLTVFLVSRTALRKKTGRELQSQSLAVLRCREAHRGFSGSLHPPECRCPLCWGNNNPLSPRLCNHCPLANTYEVPNSLGVWQNLCLILRWSPACS